MSLTCESAVAALLGGVLLEPALLEVLEVRLPGLVHAAAERALLLRRGRRRLARGRGRRRPALLRRRRERLNTTESALILEPTQVTSKCSTN